MSHDGLLIGTTVCSCVSLVLLIISLSSDYWVASGSFHWGLWKFCERSMCQSYKDSVEDYYEATRAFMLMGMLAGAASSGGLCTLFFKVYLGPISLKKLSTIATFIAGCFVLIAMSTFSGVFVVNHLATGDLHWSFGFGWTACILFFITSCLSLNVRHDQLKKKAEGAVI